MSTDALLDALRIRRTPFRYPAPAGVRTPRPTSEAHLPFASRYLPRSVILVPQLAVELEEGFRAFARQRAAVVAAPSSSIPRLVQKSAEHVQRFEAKRIADQSEGVVRSALEAVWEGVDTTVEGLETLLGFQDARGKRETGNTPEGRVPMDGTALYADVYHWAKFPQFNAGVPEVAATSGELKTPPATHTMWPKVVEDLQDNGGVCSLNDFTAAERRAVLKKAAVIAKYYERDVFYFCDGISFMVGINVTDHQSNTFDTLISDHHSLVRHHPNDPSLPVVVTSTYFAGMFDPYPIAHRLRASIVVPRDDPASADLKKAIGPKLAEAAGRTKARKAEEEKRNKEKEEQEKRGAGATAQGKKRCTLTYPDQDTITLHTLPFRPVPPHPNPYKTPPRSSKVSLPTLSPSSSVNSGYSDTPTASSFGLSSSPSTSISSIGSGQDRLPPPSSPPTSSASSAEEAAIQLASFVAQSATATVYRGVWGDKSVVVKKSRGGYEEMAWGELDTLRGPLRGAAGVVPLIQAFECEGAVFLVLEDGGEEVEEWEDLSIDSRRRLFLSLLRIHLDHHVAHGDLEPRNAVVASNGGAVRWIDWGLAETDHTCGGREQCGELRELWARFGLEGEEETMRRRAEEEGLRW